MILFAVEKIFEHSHKKRLTEFELEGLENFIHTQNGDSQDKIEYKVTITGQKYGRH